MKFDIKPVPLLYKEGDMVMGFHDGIGVRGFVAGKIVKASQSTSMFSRNSYDVELIPEFECSEDATFRLMETEIVPFDRVRALKAMLFFEEEGRLREEANRQHGMAMDEIYEFQKED